jgi:hypothetical protein
MFERHRGLRTARRILSMGCLLGLACLLAACASPKVLEPAQIVAIRKVGVIAMLPSSLVYQKVGVTVFNNERVEKPLGSALNDAARAGAATGFQLGGKIHVEQLDVDVAQVRELFRPGAIVFSWPPDKAKAFLIDMARRQGLDAIATVHEVFDPDNGFAGVQFFMRGGFNAVHRNGIRVDTEVALYGRDGALLTSRSTGLGGLYTVDRPGGRPWVYALEENLDGATQEAVRSAMAQVIKSKTAMQIGAMGF